MKVPFLRAWLGLAAVTWGAAAPGILIPWSTAADAMSGFGAGEVSYDRMLDYWLRMASCAFLLIGGIYGILAIWPQRFREMIPVMGAFALIEGVVLLVHGLRLQLGPWPFCGDVAACLVSGGGIVICWRAALQRDK